MSSLDPIPTTLSDQLQQLGLVHTASDLNDFIARTTQKRWSPVVQLERLVEADLAARLSQRVERRLKDARLGRFNMMANLIMADFDRNRAVVAIWHIARGPVSGKKRTRTECDCRELARHEVA
jgi:hypothetical protein